MAAPGRVKALLLVDLFMVIWIRILVKLSFDSVIAFERSDVVNSVSSGPVVSSLLVLKGAETLGVLEVIFLSVDAVVAHKLIGVKI
jgi:hypothetical protein